MSSEQKKTLIGDRIKQIIGNEAPFSWARKIGIPIGTFHSFWHKGADLKGSHLAKIVRITGVSPSWLLLGEGAMYDQSLSAQSQHPVVKGIINNQSAIPDSVQPVYDAFMEVMSSDDEGTKLALTQNVYTFQRTVRNEKEIVEMKRDMDIIKKRLFNEQRETDFKTQ